MNKRQKKKRDKKMWNRMLDYMTHLTNPVFVQAALDKGKLGFYFTRYELMR